MRLVSLPSGREAAKQEADAGAGKRLVQSGGKPRRGLPDHLHFAVDLWRAVAAHLGLIRKGHAAVAEMDARLL